MHFAHVVGFLCMNILSTNILGVKVMQSEIVRDTTTICESPVVAAVAAGRSAGGDE